MKLKKLITGMLIAAQLTSVCVFAEEVPQADNLSDISQDNVTIGLFDASQGGVTTDPSDASQGGATTDPSDASQGGATTDPSDASQGGVTTDPSDASQGGVMTDPSDASQGGVTPATPAAILPGDVDGNGKVDLSDAQIILRAALKIITLTGDDLKAADADEDGRITLSDAQKALKYALKIEIYNPNKVEFHSSMLESKEAYIYTPKALYIDMLSDFFDDMNPASKGKLNYLKKYPDIIVTDVHRDTFTLSSETLDKVVYSYIRQDGTFDEGILTSTDGNIPIMVPQLSNNRYGGYIYTIIFKDGLTKTFTFVDKTDFDRLNLIINLMG